MFRDSSFDNLDRTAITEQDNNGKCIAVLKNELIKEIPFSFLMQYNEILTDMIHAWDKCVYYAQDLLFQDNYVNGDWEDYEKFLASVTEKNLPWENYAKESANDSSLINTVYFWILEQECRCLRTDFLHINDHFMTNITENSYIDKDSMTGKLTNALLAHPGWKQECYSDKRELTINGVTVFKMYLLYENEEYDVGIEDMKPFLLYFKQELAEMLATPKFTISEALTLIENSHKHIQRFINPPNKNYIIDFQPSNGKYIPVSLIMASLYAMRDAYVNDEAINHSAYRGTQKNRLTHHQYNILYASFLLRQPPALHITFCVFPAYLPAWISFNSLSALAANSASCPSICTLSWFLSSISCKALSTPATDSR